MGNFWKEKLPKKKNLQKNVNNTFFQLNLLINPNLQTNANKLKYLVDASICNVNVTSHNTKVSFISTCSRNLMKIIFFFRQKSTYPIVPESACKLTLRRLISSKLIFAWMNLGVFCSFFRKFTKKFSAKYVFFPYPRKLIHAKFL